MSVKNRRRLLHMHQHGKYIDATIPASVRTRVWEEQSTEAEGQQKLSLDSWSWTEQAALATEQSPRPVEEHIMGAAGSLERPTCTAGSLWLPVSLRSV